MLHPKNPPVPPPHPEWEIRLNELYVSVAVLTETIALPAGSRGEIQHLAAAQLQECAAGMAKMVAG